MKRKLSIINLVVFASFALVSSLSSLTVAAQNQYTYPQSQINLSKTPAADLMKMTVAKTNPKNVKPTKPPVKAANPASKTYKIQIKNYKFSPATLTIKKGDKVTWTNMDSMAHTATGANFDSGNLNNGDSYSFTFTTVGEFNYVCSYHSNMTAKIIVK
jgi:plastocyanin